MGSILDRIVASKEREIERLTGKAAGLRMAAESASAARGFARAIAGAGGVAVIAEFKRRSPSAGWLSRDADAGAVARAYGGAGASAVSVLTDAEFFGGSLRDLEQVRASAGLPVLRKDFVVDECQVWEARAAGADAVLLIVRILDAERLSRLLRTAEAVGMDALVEVHDGVELRKALDAGASVIGINNRDLGTFETDLGVSLELAPAVPRDVVLVAESGIGTAKDVERLGAAGVDAVLVGEALMRAGSAAEGVASLVGQRKCARSVGQAERA